MSLFLSWIGIGLFPTRESDTPPARYWERPQRLLMSFAFTAAAYPIISSSVLFRLQSAIPVLGTGIPRYSSVFDALIRRPRWHLWRGSGVLLGVQVIARVLHNLLVDRLRSFGAPVSLCQPLVGVLLTATLTPLRTVQILLLADISAGYSGPRGVARCLHRIRGVRGFASGLFSASAAVLVHEAVRSVVGDAVRRSRVGGRYNATLSRVVSVVSAGLFAYVLDGIALYRMARALPTTSQGWRPEATLTIIRQGELMQGVVTGVLLNTIVGMIHSHI